MNFSQKAATLFMVAMTAGSIGLSAASGPIPTQKERARQRALQFFTSHPDKYNVKDLIAVDAQGAGDEYFVFRSDNSNYYVVSSREALPSVVAHSTTLNLITDTTGTAAIFLKNYKEVVNNLFGPARHFDDEGKDYSRWDCVVELENVEVQPPLLKTKWHQMVPYNNHCPGSVSKGRYLVGSVATAFAQVMNYYQYPECGKGIFQAQIGNVAHHSSLPPGCYGDSVLDLSNYPIRWDVMPDDTDPHLGKDINAVARFCEEVGYCMNMNYGSKKSNVGSINIGLSGVKNAFDYKSDGYICYYGQAEDEFRDPRITEGYMKEFFNSIVDGINTPFEDKNKIPLVAQGNGHAFVVDGYMTGGYVNIKFGWEENKGSGWYFIAQLNPERRGMYANEGNYAMQYAIKGFVPAKTPIQPDDENQLNLVVEGEFIVVSEMEPHGELEVYDQMGTKRGNYFANDSGIVRMYKRGLPSGIVIFKDVQSNRHKTVNL